MNEPTPDTVGYLVLGLVVAFGILSAFLGSIAIRYRNLQQDIQLIEQLDDKQ